MDVFTFLGSLHNFIQSSLNLIDDVAVLNHEPNWESQQMASLHRIAGSQYVSL